MRHEAGALISLSAEYPAKLYTRKTPLGQVCPSSPNIPQLCLAVLVASNYEQCRKLDKASWGQSYEHEGAKTCRSIL